MFLLIAMAVYVCPALSMCACAVCIRRWRFGADWHTEGTETPFLESFCLMTNDSFYQDRLGTNIRKS